MECLLINWVPSTWRASQSFVGIKLCGHATKGFIISAGGVTSPHFLPLWLFTQPRSAACCVQLPFLLTFSDSAQDKEDTERESSLVKRNTGYLKHMVCFHVLAKAPHWKCIMWWQKEGTYHLPVSNTANNIFLSKHRTCFCVIYTRAAGNRGRATSCFSALTCGSVKTKGKESVRRFWQEIRKPASRWAPIWV